MTAALAVAAMVTALVAVGHPAASLPPADSVTSFAYGSTGSSGMAGCVVFADDGSVVVDDGSTGGGGTWSVVATLGRLQFVLADFEIAGAEFRWFGGTRDGLLVARVMSGDPAIVWAVADGCTPVAPGPTPTTGLLRNHPGAADGYVLFSPNLSTDVFLVDRQGAVVNTWDLDTIPGLIAYLLDDGSLVRAASPGGPLGGSIPAIGGSGLVERYDWDGELIWSMTYEDVDHISHHDIEVLPNGNVLLLAWERRTEDEATAAGRDPDLPGPGWLLPDHIVEMAPDLTDGEGGEVVWEWHVWDHLVQDFDETKDNWYGPTGVSDHPELIDLNYVSTFDDGGGQPDDWTHANSVDYHPELDQIVVSVREFSEIWVIDHSTTTEEAAGHTGGRSGRGGDLLYRWGNPETHRAGTEADRQIWYQHDAKWVTPGHPGAGNITLLDNGFGQPGDDLTSLVELVPPLAADGSYPMNADGVWGPTEPVWRHTAAPEDFSALISGAQRLGNGTTLATYGPHGAFVQVAPDGREVWRYVNPHTATGELGPFDDVPVLGLPPLFDGLDTFRVNATFRATHYPPGYAPQLP